MRFNLVARRKILSTRWLKAVSLAALLSALPITLRVDLEKTSVFFKLVQASAESENSGSGSGGGSESDNDNSGSGNPEDNSGNSDKKGVSGKTRKIKDGSAYIQGDKIVILYSDGFKDQIDKGIYKLTDPKGRTIAERVATRADKVRLEALVNETSSSDF